MATYTDNQEIHVHKKESEYLVVSTDYIEDDQLSWEAKGIMTILLSCDDPEELEMMVDPASEGIQELLEQGYIEAV